MDALCAVGAEKMCHERSHCPRGFEGVFSTLFNVEPILVTQCIVTILTAGLGYHWAPLVRFLQTKVHCCWWCAHSSVLLAKQYMSLS
jgi:hypothetical protein